MRRVLTLLATAGAAALAVLAIGAATASAAPAVVFVSGLNSETSFTNATPACAGQEGDTWNSPTGPPAALRASGRDVYTAPAGEGAKAPAPCGSPTPAANTVLNSGGDADANGAALLRLLTFLKTQYGVQQVQLVAHSDGGIWSRAAITQAGSADIPTVLSLTTLGTPHTGAWSADLALGVGSLDCTSTICKLLKAIAQEEIGNLGETAVKELTSTYTADWNPDQRIAACPVTTIAGTFVKLFDVLPPFYLPTDGLVGRASAHAAASTTIGGKPIPAPSIPNLTDSGDFPVVHAPSVSFLGTKLTLLNDPAISATVASIVNAPATGPPCTAFSSGGGGSSSVRADLARSIDLEPGAVVRADADAVLHRKGTRVRCGGERLDSHGGLTRRLRISVPDDCERLTASGPALAMVHRGAVKVRRKGRDLSVRSRSLDDVSVEIRRGSGWRDLDGGDGSFRLPRRLDEAIVLRVQELEQGRDRRLAIITLDG
jgi:hypothetical protein